jgi:hypothetical protein
MPLRPEGGLVTTSRILMGLLAFVLVLAAGCGSTTSASVPAGSTPHEESGGSRDTGSTSPPGPSTGGGQVIATAAVTCHLAKRQLGGLIASDEGREEVPCSDRHNQESFTLTGTTDLDDCYRAVAASSDVRIGPDSFSNDKLDFTDGRIIGHTFATSDAVATSDGQVPSTTQPRDPVTTISCAVDLADDRKSPLIGGTGT